MHTHKSNCRGVQNLTLLSPVTGHEHQSDLFVNQSQKSLHLIENRDDILRLHLLINLDIRCWKFVLFIFNWFRKC